MRGRHLPLIPPSSLASSQMKMQFVPASHVHFPQHNVRISAAYSARSAPQHTVRIPQHTVRIPQYMVRYSARYEMTNPQAMVRNSARLISLPQELCAAARSYAQLAHGQMRIPPSIWISLFNSDRDSLYFTLYLVAKQQYLHIQRTLI